MYEFEEECEEAETTNVNARSDLCETCDSEELSCKTCSTDYK